VRLAAVLVLVTACGGSQQRAASPPIESECAPVAAHLVELAGRDNGAPMAPDQAAGVRAELERQCRDEAWSAERRSCLRDAPNQDMTLGCPRH